MTSAGFASTDSNILSAGLISSSLSFMCLCVHDTKHLPNICERMQISLCDGNSSPAVVRAALHIFPILGTRGSDVIGFIAIFILAFMTFLSTSWNLSLPSLGLCVLFGDSYGVGFEGAGVGASRLRGLGCVGGC